jgi:hypothetical protein
MKFPNNTDAWAYHLGALATCTDQSDFRVMLQCARASAIAPPAARVCLEVEQGESPAGAAAYIIEQDERAREAEAMHEAETERRIRDHYADLASQDEERERDMYC